MVTYAANVSVGEINEILLAKDGKVAPIGSRNRGPGATAEETTRPRFYPNLL